MKYGESERNRTLAKEAEKKKNFTLGLLMIISFIFIFLLAGVLIPKKAHAADNIVNIDQVGTGNTTTVSQDGDGHSAVITVGSISPTNYNVFSIMQQGAPKTASIELKAGINNTFAIQQDGTGNHTAAIQNMIGSGNNVNITQQGAGSHIFNITNPYNATNDGNTVTATQTGGAGANKRFDLTFSGASNAGVTIQQTNPTQANEGGMNIQCTNCGSGWSYIRF
jgi:hypothetical protein